jgi:type I restriction enzyme, S subunit
MNFPRYPKYKASGVEWLGDVPEHWGAGRLRRFARRYSGGTPDKTNLAYWQDGVIPWLNSGAVNDRLISVPSTFITAEAFTNSSAKWVPAGALVMALAGQGKTKGMVAQLAIPSTCNQSIAAIVPNPKLNARFLLWWLDSNYQSIRNLAGGDLRDGLNLELVGDIPLPVVPLPEQTAIVEFLDRETAKIDGLVADYRRLMELLKEKRQAVISHAVTKGLDPDAPMKPSGIEWLGDVPEHWRTGRLGYLVDLLVDGTHFSPPNGPEGDFKYITAKNIKEHGFDFTEITYVTAEEHSKIYPRCPVRRGDVLYIKDGATAGIAMVNPTEEQFSMLSSVALIRPIITILIPEFVAYHLNAGQFKNDALNKLVGGAMTRFTVDMIKRFVFAMPPIQEQESIITFLDIQTAKFDALTADAQQAIDLLQERRTALISAAVTGQIDVRQQPRN